MLNKASKVLKALKQLNLDNVEVCAIIAAAGSSCRMGENKQLIKLCEQTTLEWSVAAFLDSRFIKSIVIVCRAEDIEQYKQLPRLAESAKPIYFAIGGRTRQESVANAFEVMMNNSPNSKVVAIHDGARPAITSSDIEAVISDCLKHGAATAATPVVDTLKLAGEGEFIDKTVNRSNLWAVQTPQVFLRDLYTVSLAMAKKDDFTATDDCSLVEHAGFKVHLCETSRENIKLTSPADIDVLYGVLRYRRV